jgi:hypothetical protein
MRKLALVISVALLAATPAGLFAAAGQPVLDGYLDPGGYTQVTSLATAAGLGTIPNGVKLTLIQAEAQDIRWRDDGVNPTASVGMVLGAGQTLVYNGNPAAFKAIEVTTSAKLNVIFYR